MPLTIDEVKSEMPIGMKVTNHIGQAMHLGIVDGDLRIEIGAESIWIEAECVEELVGAIHKLNGD